ncbi:uncharacterized protein [Lolium perenne]|uniref:uncharacterized protein n=1 Tax=Lolium perenne TaxID=4522 RepID=UPI003A98D9FF
MSRSPRNGGGGRGGGVSPAAAVPPAAHAGRGGGTPPRVRSVTPVPLQRRRSQIRGPNLARRGGGEVVVREVVRELAGGSSANLSFPMLTRTNYVHWAMVMEVNLQAASLWDAIEFDAVTRRWWAKGRRRRHGRPFPSRAKGVTVYVTRLRRLRAEFETVTFKDGERIADFSMRISNLAAALSTLGDAVYEERIVRKFLSVVPTKFVQIAFSMETLHDPALLTVEEVTGHLRAIEERLDGDQVTAGGQLLLTEEQWEAKKKQTRGGRTGGRGNDNPKPTAPAKTSQSARTSKNERAQNGDVDKEYCRYCSKKGHWARECRKKQHDEAASAAANLVQDEEEEAGPGLMMACVEEVIEPMGELAAVQTTEIA